MDSEMPDMTAIGEALQAAQYAMSEDELVDARTALAAAAAQLHYVTGDLPSVYSALDGAQETIHQAEGAIRDAQAKLTAYATAVGVTLSLEADTPQPALPPIPQAGQDSAAQPRTAFMKTRGFTFYTHINEIMLGKLGGQNIERMPTLLTPFNMGAADLFTTAENIQRAADNPAGLSLMLTVRRFAHLIPQPETLLHYPEVSDQDVEDTRPHTFVNGFNDPQFPWHFSAGLANQVTDFLVASGHLTQEQKNALTIRDWADMIGSAWFRSLVHSLAFTGNGVYAQFGTIASDYEPDTLHACIQRQKPDTPLATVSKEDFFQATPTPGADGQTSLSVRITPQLADALHEYMRTFHEGSTGCPVARHAANLPMDQIANDPHTKELIDRGMLTVTPARPDATSQRVIAEQTTIDHTLLLIADQLRWYDANYGTPQLSYQPAKGSNDLYPRIEHIQSPATLRQTDTGVVLPKP